MLVFKNVIRPSASGSSEIGNGLHYQIRPLLQRLSSISMTEGLGVSHRTHKSKQTLSFKLKNHPSRHEAQKVISIFLVSHNPPRG